jgi:amino acid permease
VHVIVDFLAAATFSFAGVELAGDAAGEGALAS